MAFVLLNPSTADATNDDPTIRRLIAFAKREGVSGITVVNLYAYRATRPADLKRAGYLVGPENAAALSAVASGAVASGLPVICAWGVHGRKADAQAAADTMRAAGATLACFGVTKNGAPRHPLYVRGDAQRIPFRA